MAATLYDKLWDAHLVADLGGGKALLYIDRQLLHEVSSPQAFAALIAKQAPLHRRGAHLAVADHAVPTAGRAHGIADPQARAQVALLAQNCDQFGITNVTINDPRQGIVHVVGPEQGFTLPGMTLVCGDSHTATHGAFGALAFGIGTSEAECVLRTQTLIQTRARTMRVVLTGRLAQGVTAKDAILALIARIGTAGAVGHAIEYQGEAVRTMTMAARMTLCNMTIEAGARIGLIAPDDTTFAWLRDRPMAPTGTQWDKALAYWQTLPSDADARFDREVAIDAATIAPQVSWGTSPDQTIAVDAAIPHDAPAQALAYMGLTAGVPIKGLAIDHVFIGSCTNGRIEDLRAAAAIVAGRHIAPGLRALVVPGSGLVKRQAEIEGLDRIFASAGFEWRDAGCSLCVAMNDDRLPPGARCASTSNRNFEGRQGVGARTHLMSPAMAAAAAVTGHITDVRDLA